MNRSRNSRSRGLGTIAALAVVTVMLAALSACEGDPYGSLVCTDGPTDTLYVYARSQVRQLEVRTDSAESLSSLHSMQSLYLGDDGRSRSEILVNFDFGAIDDTRFPPALFNTDSIRSVTLNLTRLIRYTRSWRAAGDSAATPSAPAIRFTVRQLVAPFRPADYDTFPGPVAVGGPGLLNQDLDANDSDEPSLALYPDDLVSWYAAQSTVGLVIGALGDSDPELVGFAASELESYGEIPQQAVGSVAAPALVVEFRTRQQNLIIAPVADTSTFEQVAAPLAGLLTVRTGLTSFPVVTFDVPELPPGTCLAGVFIQGNTETLAPVMARECLQFAWIDPTRIDLDQGSVRMSELRWASQLVATGCNLLDQAADKNSRSPYDIAGTIYLAYGFGAPWTNSKAELYFSESTFSGPSAGSRDRPALVFLTRPAGE